MTAHSLRSRILRDCLVAAGLILTAVLMAPLGGKYTISLAILVLFYTYVASCWNIVGGFAGQFSLGHATFFGIGAYACSYVSSLDWSPWLGVAAGVALSGLLAWLIGAITFRAGLKGSYFAIGTLAIAEIVRVLMNNIALFGRGAGISIALRTPGLANLQFNDPRWFLGMFGLMAFGSLCAIAVLARSRFGYRLLSTRENEAVATSIGVDPNRQKLIGFIISAMMIAPAGSLYSRYLMFVDPDTFFSISATLLIILPCLVGGPGTVFGPFVGAIVIVASREILGAISSSPGVPILAYGLVLCAVSLLSGTQMLRAGQSLLSLTKGRGHAAGH